MLESKVPDGAVVHLQHRNLVVAPDLYSNIANVTRPAALSVPGFLTGTQLSPTNLTVTAGLEQQNSSVTLTTGTGLDAATVGLGAQIVGDPGAAISLSSYGMTAVYGSITAPGGKITLAVNSSILGADDRGPLYLGPGSVLDASGAVGGRSVPGAGQYGFGLCHSVSGRDPGGGGTVTLTDGPTDMLVAPGAVINVSGASRCFRCSAVRSWWFARGRTGRT